MVLRRAFAPAVLSWAVLTASLTAGSESRRWQTGTVLSTDSQMMVKTTTWGPRPAERRYFQIDPGKESPIVYVLIQEETSAKKLAVLTVNQPVRFAIEGETVYVIDEKQRELKMKIFSKTARAAAQPTAAAAAAQPTAAAAAEELPGGDIKKGMTTAEVEQVLGKPLRNVGFGQKSQWLYKSLTVVFEDGRVVDVSF